MKAISLWQPWAYCMAVGWKAIETRARATTHRGPLAIHASKRSMDAKARALCALLREKGYEFDPAVLAYGAIIGAVKVTNCKRVEEVRGDLMNYDENGKPYDWEIEYDLGDYSDHRFAWLTDACPVLLGTPVPMSGRQGFFEIPDQLRPPISVPSVTSCSK